MIDSLIAIFERDLQRLHNQIEMYSSDDLLWSTVEGVTNSGGNLCLGGQLGNTGYVRDRHAEFNDKFVDRNKMLADVLDTKVMVTQTIQSLSATDLEAVYPIEVFKKPMTTQFFLIHLATHLSYHLGQINYHRRILSRAI